MLCVSQASTAICLSMDEASSSSSSTSALPLSSTAQLGGRAIDRHNPIIGRRPVPCSSSSSQPPINPKPYHQLQKTKNASSTPTTTPSKQNDQKRKSNGGGTSQPKLPGFVKTDRHYVIGSKKKSFSGGADNLVTPPGSSRYLLGDAAFLDGLSTDCNNPVSSLVPVGNKKNQELSTCSNNNNNNNNNVTASSSQHYNQSKPPQSNQVVVLRVSLHCKGCEGKVRKHLSRMEGVTSFNIDFAAKKVTVVGDVTPVSVLASISKVKNAQIWSPGGVSSVVSVSNPNPTPNQETMKI